MGIVTMGPPENLVLFLKNTFGIMSFVETGTFQGGTAFWASKLFNTVHTIELSETLSETARARFEQAGNIEFVAGDSRRELPKICEKLSGPVLFWLDAHYSAGITAGGGERVPVLGEIEAIDCHMPDAFIMIDDARLFEMPPPQPHAQDEYPSLLQTLEALNRKIKRYIAIVDDVIVAVPEAYAQPVKDFLQYESTVKHGLRTEETAKSDYRKALDLLAKGLSGSLRGMLRRTAVIRNKLWSR
jgi:hypothetical protein